MQQKKITKKFWLILIGLLISSGIPIIGRYLTMSDIVKGALVGFGIGLMIVGIGFNTLRRGKS